MARDLTLNGQSRGNGLGNMRRRAQAMGENVTIESRPGQGTTVRLSCILRRFTPTERPPLELLCKCAVAQTLLRSPGLLPRGKRRRQRGYDKSFIETSTLASHYDRKNSNQGGDCG
jgi:hypothetical protein